VGAKEGYEFHFHLSIDLLVKRHAMAHYASADQVCFKKQGSDNKILEFQGKKITVIA
jgi:hypothetical protein